MKRLLKEPLLHFFVIGAGLFLAYRSMNREPAAGPQQIAVGSGQIEHLLTTFTRTWQRPPSDEEMKGLIDQFVREEILSREAIKLGLDQNDTVIRRRLQQKMEFIAEGLAAVSEPTEAELADYLAKNPEAFRQEQRFTFRQVFLNPNKRGTQLETDAAAMLATLKLRGAEADVSEWGDGFLLPHGLTNEPQRSVVSQFGQEFAIALGKLKPDEWSGSIRSGYGVHLVFISQRTDGGPLALEDVREQVKRELLNTRRLAANRKLLNDLLTRYQVTIEWPKPESQPEVKKTAMKQ